MRFRLAPVLLCLLLAFSGICSSLCAAPAMADLQQHPCCPHQSGDQSCGHAAAGHDSQAILPHVSRQVSLDASLSVLPHPLHFAAPPSAQFTSAPLAVRGGISPHRHFVLRL